LHKETVYDSLQRNAVAVIAEKKLKINLALEPRDPIDHHWTRRAYALTQGRPARPPIAYPLNPLGFSTHGLGNEKGNVMRWSPLLSVVIGLSIATGRLLSQETPVGDGSGWHGPPPKSILCDSHAAHFRLILGRIELDSVRYRKGTISRKSGPNNLAVETLSIDATRGIPRLHYTRQVDNQRLTLDVNESGRLLIESQLGDQRVVVVQSSGRPISVELCVGGRSDIREVDSWFHLYVSDPATYFKHFQPLIDDLLHGTPLDKLADAAHGQAIATLSSASVTSDATIDRYIDLLGSTQRTSRIEAQRGLYQCGISLLPRLRQIDPQRLDAEQRYRLQQVIEQLTPYGEDCQSRVAAMIRDDYKYWLAARDRLTPADQSLISARMSDLGGADTLSIAKSNMKDAVRVASVPADDDRHR
jgi:hypothetical protein